MEFKAFKQTAAKVGFCCPCCRTSTTVGAFPLFLVTYSPRYA